MKILAMSSMVIDKDHYILTSISSLGMWPVPGEIRTKEENGDFDLLMNHLQHGKGVWVSRVKGSISIIDIHLTEKLWDARALAFAPHDRCDAHSKLTNFCFKNDLLPVPTVREDGPVMAQGRLAGALQELFERGDEKECEGWLEMKTQLERIIRKRMAERNEADYHETCDRCRLIGPPNSQRESSLQGDILLRTPPEMDETAIRAYPTRDDFMIVDYHTKRKGKGRCFRGCTKSACTFACGVDPSKAWYKSMSPLKYMTKCLFVSESDSKSRSEAESQGISDEDTSDAKSREKSHNAVRSSTRHLPYWPHNWEIKCNDSKKCNDPKWKGFKCPYTETTCPGTFPECPHVIYQKPG